MHKMFHFLKFNGAPVAPPSSTAATPTPTLTPVTTATTATTTTPPTPSRTRSFQQQQPPPPPPHHHHHHHHHVMRNPTPIPIPSPRFIRANVPPPLQQPHPLGPYSTLNSYDQFLPCNSVHFYNSANPLIQQHVQAMASNPHMPSASNLYTQRRRHPAGDQQQGTYFRAIF